MQVVLARHRNASETSALFLHNLCHAFFTP